MLYFRSCMLGLLTVLARPVQYGISSSGAMTWLPLAKTCWSASFGAANDVAIGLLL